MAFVSYEIPPEFKDEERWFKIFSMKSLKVFLGTGLIGLIIFKIFEFLGLMILGIILGAAFCIGCTVFIRDSGCGNGIHERCRKHSGRIAVKEIL